MSDSPVDLAMNTMIPSEGPRYDVYLSYDRSESERAQNIRKCLTDLDKRCFDEFELIPGVSKTATRENALKASKTIAILVGASGFSRLSSEEARQSLSRSIDDGVRVFLVYLPGYRGDQTSIPPGLSDRKEIDLQNQFADQSGITIDGVSALLSGIEGVTLDEARALLASRSLLQAARVPSMRAFVVTVEHYNSYDELPAANADREALERLLGSLVLEKGASWDIVKPQHATRQGLAAAAKDFLSTDVQPDDTLLFYFSGHGEVEEDGEAYLCVESSNHDDLFETAFSISKGLAKYVRDSPSRRKLVVLDCCFAGEASDEGTNWGDGTAVFMTSRQWVPAHTGTSELTSALAGAWTASVVTTGKLMDALSSTDVRTNSRFDRAIPLPAPSANVGASITTRPAARLVFDENGELSIRLTDGGKESRASDMAGWLEGRRNLVGNLIELVDAVVSLVPPDQIPMNAVEAAFKSLGADLLGSTLTKQVRAELSDLNDWGELRLELSFDERWAQRDAWERVPWECLSLCLDGERQVSLERIVRAKATKSNATRTPPRRVIAWNAFVEPNAPYPNGSIHLLTHLLREGLSDPASGPTLVVKEPARWIQLCDASKSKKVSETDDGEYYPITDFDTMVIFAPVTLNHGEPELWLHHDGALRPIRAAVLLGNLSSWTCSYVILETIAGSPTHQSRTDSAPASHARSLQATAQLATKLAGHLNATVVAVCHSPHFVDVARPNDDSVGLPQLGFSGALLRELADPTKSVCEAAREARRVVDNRLYLDDSLHIGLPIVCRPEPERKDVRVPASKSTALPRVIVKT